MKKADRFKVLAIDESVHDLRAIESEAMDSLDPRCAFRGHIDLAAALSALLEQYPDLVIVGDTPRAGFAGGGIFARLRAAGYSGPIAVVSREPSRILTMAPAEEPLIGVIDKKDFSRRSFQVLVQAALAARKPNHEPD